MEQIKVLGLDDDSAFLADLKIALEPEYLVRVSSRIPEALAAIPQYRPDVLILDINMPEATGLEVLSVVKQRMGDLPVIMLTGEANIESVIGAMKSGASDYVVKGSEDFLSSLKIKIGQVTTLAKFKRQNDLLTKRVKSENARYEILGIAPSVIRLRAEIEKFKNTNAYVLILGENGTGKELVARNLHLQENDPTRPFVAVNCGAISPNLFESELFGHVKGSFTGAFANQDGKFVQANGGDIFLDEIGELPLDMQVKLLRVLQEKVVTPVGSNKSIQIDVRVITATNKKLEELVQEGKFRQDLFYRLNQIILRTASLRERREDIHFLAQHFATKRLPGVRISKDAQTALESHSWAGNIRELENTIERACLLIRGTGSTRISPEHLMLADIQAPSGITLSNRLFPKNSDDVTKDKYQECVDWVQKTFFEKGLELLRGDNNELIKRLGVSRSYFYERKRELGISKPQDSRAL